MGDRRYVFMYVISDRKRKEELEEELHSFGAAFINCVFGRGYFESRNLLDYMGFSAKKGKVIFSCIIERNRSLELIERLNVEHGFNQPNSGIAFTTPIEKAVY